MIASFAAGALAGIAIAMPSGAIATLSHIILVTPAPSWACALGRRASMPRPTSSA